MLYNTLNNKIKKGKLNLNPNFRIKKIQIVLFLFKQGILEWVVGDRNGERFTPLWEKVKKWDCYFYVTDG